MFQALLSVLIILSVILGSEILWQRKLVRVEWSRKLVHITVGTCVAFWPFFIPFWMVQVAALAFGVGVAASRYLHLFPGIHKVKRKTWGELFYPLGIGAAALLTTNKYVFAAAVLHLSLADGLAAIVGQEYGKGNQYRIGELTKSYAGTISFCLASAMITFWTVHHLTGLHVGTWALLVIMPLTTAFVENVVPFGSDNTFIPLTVIGLLGLALI